MLKITEILMDYEKAQTGITHMPQFSWKLESDRRNVMQDGYVLQIASDEAFAKLLYDSGRVRSSASAQILPGNVGLQSARRYFVRAKAEASGEETDWSCTSFVTGLMEPGEWKAVPVTAEEEADAQDSKGTYVRKAFSLGKEIREAFVCATAFGLYHFYINGRRVGSDELTPGWTSYGKHLCYQTYDVTEYLKQGENAMGAILAPGWYKGKVGDGKITKARNHYGTRTAFLAQLCVRYADGTEETLGTDGSWSGADAPVTFAEIYDGEMYDARKEIRGWAEAGALSGSWRPVGVLDYDPSVLDGQGACRVTVQERIRAERIFRTPQGDTVADFGQNMSACIQVTASGRAGDVIELQCFEILDAAGNVYLDNLRRARQCMRYTFVEDGEITYRPSFTFMGFRYARIISFPGTPAPENFTACVLHSDMRQTGSFECSNPDLNQLAHNILWGLKSNFLDVPTDCPQRDERLGWTGDAQIFCRAACFLMDTYSFYRKWLKDLAADQLPEGGVPYVIPNILPSCTENDHSSAAWSDAAVVVPWTAYLMFGDTVILEEQYESMKKWVDFMWAHSDDYIWSCGRQFGDWVALDAEQGSYRGATPNDLICTAWFAYSAELFAKTAKILGRGKDSETYGALCGKIREKFQRTFFDGDGEMTVQTQTAHILALYFRLTPPRYVEKTVGGLLRLLDKYDGHLVTGFIGTPYFCHALSQNGHVKEAYALLLRDDFPSWLYQVKMGATTVWEHWDGLREDGTMWSPDMNSFNHYAYGAVGEWMFRAAAGLEADEAAPGYRHMILYPRIDDALSYVKARYDSVYGPVRSRWEIRGREVKLDISVPANTTASVRLDRAVSVKDSDGLDFVPMEGYMEAEAGSGDYEIIFERAQSAAEEAGKPV